MVAAPVGFSVIWTDERGYVINADCKAGSFLANSNWLARIRSDIQRHAATRCGWVL